MIEEVAGNNGTGRPVLPPLPSTELNLNIPSSLSLSVQQQALERRHSMQQVGVLRHFVFTCVHVCVGLLDTQCMSLITYPLNNVPPSL